MTRNGGEQELVLGNKQLLSAFFVVAILLGVFFTMGYFVGRNSTGAANASGPASNSAQTRPDSTDKPGAASPQAAPQDDTPQASGRNPPVSGADDPSGARNAASSDSSAAKPPRESSVVDRDQSLARPTSEQMYLQVFALRRADADNEVKVLKDHGFPALIGESSKQGIYRVLVGPFKTQTELGHVKSALKAKGFDSIVAR
jgi:cell division septation protein DedD